VGHCLPFRAQWGAARPDACPRLHPGRAHIICTPGQIDDEILGINKGESYFFAYVAPGKHVFWSKSENVDALELTVEAGKTYYIQQHVRMGGFRARTKLEVLDEAEGTKGY
jgi:hypothetical protein